MVIFTALFGVSAQQGECGDLKEMQGGGLQEGHVLVPPSPHRRMAQWGTDPACSKGMHGLLPGSPGTCSHG